MGPASENGAVTLRYAPDGHNAAEAGHLAKGHHPHGLCSNCLKLTEQDG